MEVLPFDPHWLSTHRFGLVDASLRDELPTQWPQTVIAPAFLGQDTGRCPALIDLAAIEPSERGALCERLVAETEARDESLCSLLIATPWTARQVAESFAVRLQVKLEPRGAIKQFRFFDPGTFLQLPGILGDAGMAWLLAGIDSVIVPWAAHWTQCETPRATGPFHLTPEHVQALLRLGVVNRVAAFQNPPVDPFDWTTRCRQIDGHIRRAVISHGLNRRDDLVAFARHAIEHHAQFDRHPRIAALFKHLRLASDDEVDYRDLSAQLTPEDWRAIVSDLRTPIQAQGATP